MSHISTVKLTIDDLDALADACAACGVELRREQRTFRTYAGVATKCDAAIVVPGSERAYELGLTRVRVAADGTTTSDPEGGAWALSHDDWAGAGGMVDRVGRGCRKLLQAYGVAKTRRIAKAKGWSYREERQEDGSVRCYVAPTQKKAWAGAGSGGRTW